MEPFESPSDSTRRSRFASDSSSIGRPSWAGYLALGVDDGDKIEEKKKSLECSAIRISIDRTELSRNQKDGSTYISFVIAVTSGFQTWNIRRRYTGANINV